MVFSRKYLFVAWFICMACLFDFFMRVYVSFVSFSRVVLVVKVVICWLGVLRVRGVVV